METRKLGKSGVRVSLVGLGCNNFGWRIGLEESRAVIHKALDLGITLFDTADVYGNKGGSESALGEILGPRRKDIVLATKFGLPMSDGARPANASRAYIMSAVDASLKRLKTDWIDLYQLHVPDPETPLEETLRAMDELVKQGKVRHIGCSNLPGRQVIEAADIAERCGLSSFVSCQDHYSLLARGIEQELIPVIERLGMGLLPYFPLASGMLTGKYRRGDPMPDDARLTVLTELGEQFLTDENWGRIERLRSFAEARGKSLLQLAFAWLAAHPVVSSIIAGATKPSQLEQNVAAVTWKLDAAAMAEVGRLSL